MIKRIEIKDFKIHSNLSIDLGGLTILTGQNGMGKSSILQAMLLLRQSCNNDGLVQGINLKGDLVDLGCAEDIECQSCNDAKLGIDIILDDNRELNFCFDYGTDTYSTYLQSLGTNPDAANIKSCALFTENFQYISAFRLGPQKGYERDTNIVELNKQISKNNGRCEYAVHYLNHFGNKLHCIPELLFEGTDDDTLNTQVQLWLQQVSPRINIDIEPVGVDFKLNYKFSREDNVLTQNMSATNVGYGITYVLPILVAILSAKPGSMILIENPEAHIHPRAQAELMKLVMKATKAGIQIIMETHSDHIMNGALVNIVKDETIMNLVKAYYFERDEHLHTSVPIPLHILRDGRIIEPPKGFFDQIDIDTSVIMGF